MLADGESPLRRESVARSSVVFLALLIVVLSLFTGYSVYFPAGGMPVTRQAGACDSNLLNIPEPPAYLCLQNIQVSISASNESEFVVPVMVMSTGSSTVVQIMYLLNSQSVGWPVPHRNVTSSQVPVAISVPTGRVTQFVKFSNASLVFEDTSVMIYDYIITSLPGSTGYYAILPPYYFGMLPALAVGAGPNQLNATALSMWGYSGTFLSSEVTIPSRIVGVGSMVVVNSTIPMIPDCPNAACNIISHSGI